MAKSIIHGIGHALLRDYKTPSKIIAMTDMQNLTCESSSSEDAITGGNRVFPIASFPKDQGFKVSAANATFPFGIVEYLEGVEVSTGSVVLTDFVEVAIPENGIVELDLKSAPTNVFVADYEKAETVSKGKFKVESKTVTFDKSEAGTVVVIVYEYNSSATAVEYASKEGKMKKPFVFDYIFPIYDEDTQITHKGFIKIYKAQCTSGFKIDAKHQEAFAPSFEAEARTANRADGKTWSFFIDGVEVA